MNEKIDLVKLQGLYEQAMRMCWNVVGGDICEMKRIARLAAADVYFEQKDRTGLRQPAFNDRTSLQRHIRRHADSGLSLG